MLKIEKLIFDDGVLRYLNSRKKIVEDADNVFLFGSARGGEKVYDYLRPFGLQGKICYVVDNDPMKQGKFFHGVEIISVDRLKSEFLTKRNAVILIASGSAHIIRNQLLEKGFPSDTMHPFVITNLQMNPTPYCFFKDKKKEIQEVYDILADEKSKDVFISLLNFKMTQDVKWLENISDDEHDQYFDEVMNLSESESFVDCGAYIGDTLDEYNKRTHGIWNNFYCFEADPDIFKVLKQHVKEEGYSKVSLFNVGCWDKKTTLSFEKAGSGSSSITDNNTDVEIKADTIDEVLRNKPVSVIKMDIEGAEQNALRGAAKIINEQRPKLAISIYHSLADFIKIPAILNEYGNGYKIYIRHYRELTDSETICYAI